MRSNAPVKRYSPVRKSGDHRSIGTHIPGTDMSDNMCISKNCWKCRKCVIIFRLLSTEIVSIYVSY